MGSKLYFLLWRRSHKVMVIMTIKTTGVRIYKEACATQYSYMFHIGHDINHENHQSDHIRWLCRRCLCRPSDALTRSNRIIPPGIFKQIYWHDHLLAWLFLYFVFANLILIWVSTTSCTRQAIGASGSAIASWAWDTQVGNIFKHREIKNCRLICLEKDESVVNKNFSPVCTENIGDERSL